MKKKKTITRFYRSDRCLYLLCDDKGRYWGGFYVSYWGGTLNSEASGYGKFQFGRYKDYPGGESLSK